MKLIGYVLSKRVSYVCGLFLGIVSFKKTTWNMRWSRRWLETVLSRRQDDSFQLVKMSGIKAGKYISYKV